MHFGNARCCCHRLTIISLSPFHKFPMRSPSTKLIVQYGVKREPFIKRSLGHHTNLDVINAVPWSEVVKNCFACGT